ncbi:hypothetical protein GCM10023238_08370 [Streptomyces heliomycini]
MSPAPALLTAAEPGNPVTGSTKKVTAGCGSRSASRPDGRRDRQRVPFRAARTADGPMALTYEPILTHNDRRHTCPSSLPPGAAAGCAAALGSGILWLRRFYTVVTVSGTSMSRPFARATGSWSVARECGA